MKKLERHLGYAFMIVFEKTKEHAVFKGALDSESAAT